MPHTFYWHDYETWGADPRRDRAAQFAGVRTDADLNPIGRPLVLYCKPADDLLPQPEACLITGITPQIALREGVCEAEFFAAIHDELSATGTCGVGYNTIRFDDEFTRNGFYRNFFDPYAREYQNGNSRWDLIDIVRLTHALRPEGIEWPQNEDGSTSFRLERLTAANGIAHQGAHDALSDVFATIELARLIRARQPRLFDWAFENRTKQAAQRLLAQAEQGPILHISSRYPASRGCLALVTPVGRHPTNPNGIVVFDLAFDPEPLLTLPDEQVHRRLFSAADDLGEGEARIPLKTVHINKCPVLAPLNTLTPQVAERWGVDVDLARARLTQIKAAAGLAEKIGRVHQMSRFPPATDPDHALYDAFLPDADRRLCEQVHRADPETLQRLAPRFQDPRLPELLFRYRARNWPQGLGPEERVRWETYRRRRLTEPDGGGSIALKEYRLQLARMMVQPDLGERERALLSELAEWPGQLRL